MADKELIQEILLGNNNAFKTLVEKYQQQVFRVVMGFVHSKEDAEDVTQDIFIKVYQSLSSFKGKSEFSTWLYRVAVNMSLNFINRNKKNSILESLEKLFHKSSDEKTPLEQMAVFREVNRKLKHVANTLIYEMDSLKVEMFNELNKDTPDSLRVKELSNHIGMHHTELKEITNEYYLKLKSVCNETQREQLKEAFLPLFKDGTTTNVGSGYRRGQGPRDGRGRGVQ